MAEQGKTPIPKSQREISKGLREPSIEGNDPNNVTKYATTLADARTNNTLETFWVEKLCTSYTQVSSHLKRFKLKCT